MASALTFLVAVVLMAGVYFTSGVSISVAATPTPPHSATKSDYKCGSPIHFFAYDAPKGSNNFGPTQTSTDLKKVADTFGKVLSTDPAAAASDVLFVRNGSKLSATKAEAKAKSYVKDKKAWCTDVTNAMAKVNNFTVENIAHTFDTLGMIPGKTKNDMPRIVKQSAKINIGPALVAHLKDGSTRVFRITCFFQPSNQRFVNVAPQPTTRTPSNGKGQSPGTSRHVTTTPPQTTPPKTTPPTTTPPTKHVCTWPTPHGTWPICKDSPSRDPQSNNHVPTQAVKHHPSADNGSEIAHGPSPVVDQGNGIPQGTPPRSTPSPAPTTIVHVGPGPVIPSPTAPPAPAPSPTATATAPIPPPPGVD